MWIRGEQEVSELFSIWNGGRGEVWEYVCGHGLLLIRLDRGIHVKLFVLCADCRTVQFPSIGWRNVNLKLIQKYNPSSDDSDFRFQLQDGDRFVVTCRGISAIETDKNVLIDWPPESRQASHNCLLI